MCKHKYRPAVYPLFFIFVPWIHLAGWKQPRLCTIWGRSYTNLKIFVAWSIESVNKYDKLNSSNLEKLPFGAWTNWKFSPVPKMWPRVDSMEVFLWRPAKETCHNCESVRQRRRHEGHTFFTFSCRNVPQRALVCGGGRVFCYCKSDRQKVVATIRKGSLKVGTTGGGTTPLLRNSCHTLSEPRQLIVSMDGAWSHLVEIRKCQYSWTLLNSESSSYP